MTTMIEQIKKLREETGAGVQACRLALENANGNIDLARINLREQIEAEAAKRTSHQASQGRIDLYSHGDGRIGVMVETGTETDFAARSELLRKLSHELAMQIAAANPSYVRDEDIPADVLAQESQKAFARARCEGKPENLIPRIADGYIKKFKDERVLLRQPYIRDQTLSVAQLVSQAAASVGENVVVRRFVRWELDPEKEK